MEETVFDRYTEISAKDHERQRRAGVGSNTFNLDLNSPLPSREAVMKNKHNKRGLSRLLSTFNLGCGVSVESRDDGVFLHDEPDITSISYLFQAADAGRQVVRILSDDSDIFVLLVYWTWRYDLQVRVSVQMEKWDGVVLDINATCANLWDTVCSQLLGAHALSGCDTVSYPFVKGKASVLKTLKAGNFWGLFDVLGEESATHVDLMVVGQHFFAALWTTHGNLDDSRSLQSVHPQTGEATAHHVTASDGHKPLPPRATCSPADVALEGSWPTGTSRCLHRRLWLENRR